MPATSQRVDKTKLKRVGVTCINFNLRKASRQVTRHYDQRLEPIGLRSTQFSILAAIGRHDAMLLSSLAELLVMDRTTLTRNLKPLEKMGLVRYRKSTDRRKRELELTARGWRTLERALPLWEEAQQELFAKLGDDNRRGLLKHIWRLMYGKANLDA